MSLFRGEKIVEPVIEGAQIKSSTGAQGATPAAVTSVPAGGTGAAAGGWDTAGNRDLAITRINDLISKFNTLVTDLRNAGILQ